MKTRPCIMLTGANGQVGWELQRTLACLGEVNALDSKALDLADPTAIRTIVGKLKPDIIVNAAAYTKVDQAESESDLAHAINARAPGILAEEAEKLGSLLVHYSTEYVFDGSGNTPWKEDDETGPLSVYGESKLAGEHAIQSASSRHLIFRTSWVYGNRGSNFLLTMRRLMHERPSLNIVSDQIGAPTWSRMLGEATAAIITRQLATGDSVTSNTCGIYHMTNAGACSWYEFAKAIQERDPVNATAKLSPIPSEEYPTPAARPLNSRLKNEKLTSTFGVRLPDWRRALRLCMQGA